MGVRLKVSDVVVPLISVLQKGRAERDDGLEN